MMQYPITIRMPQSGEGQQLLNYFRKFFQESSEFLNYPSDHYNQQTAETQEKFIDVFKNSQDSIALFAFNNEEAIGSLILKNFGYPAGRHCAHLATGVLKDWQQQGHGARLLHNALSLAPKLSISHIELRVRAHNKPAIALYEKFDFTCVGVLPKSARTAAGIHDELIYFKEIIS